MTTKLKPAVIATKIKKWLEVAHKLQTEKIIFALPTTRLTSIKSLCQDETGAERFALHIARRVQQQMNEARCPETFSQSEWEEHKTFMCDAIAQMEGYLATPDAQRRQSIRAYVEANRSMVRRRLPSGVWDDGALCPQWLLAQVRVRFAGADFPKWAYKLAREYVEHYQPSYGSGLIPESVPMLLEVAEFWCQYYFDQSLSDKFPTSGK